MSGRQTRSKSYSPPGGDLISAHRSPRANLRVNPYPSPSSSSRTSPSPSSLGLAKNWVESPLTSLDSSPAAAPKRGERRVRLRQASSGLDSDDAHSDGSPSIASKAPSPEAEAGPSSTPLGPPRTSSATPSSSPSPPSQSPSPAPSSRITRRVTRSCARNVELDSLQDNLPSCSRRASPKSRNLDPPQDEPEPLDWTEEVEKVKSILPHLPSNPQPWRALDPGLMKYLMLCEEARAGQEGTGRPLKLVKSESFPLLFPCGC